MNRKNANKDVDYYQKLKLADMNTKVSGIRGEPFVKFLKKLYFKWGKLSHRNIDRMVNSKTIHVFEVAFTSAAYNPKKNYEGFEFAGDGVLNSATSAYIRRRASFLYDEPEFVAYLGLIKSQLIGKEVLAKFSEKLGIEKYINSTAYERRPDRFPSVLEDVLEAWFGATSLIMQSICAPLCGVIANTIIEGLHDTYHGISRNYFDIVDPISQVTIYHSKIGQKLDITFNKEQVAGRPVFTTKIVVKKLIGKGVSNVSKQISKRLASLEIIKKLQKKDPSLFQPDNLFKSFVKKLNESPDDTLEDQALGIIERLR